MRYWQFRDFVDQTGRNQIRHWLDGLSVNAQMKIDAFIRNLETRKQLRPPHTKALKGTCDGLIELRIKANRIQYRPLAFYGPEQGQVTIVFGAIEKGDSFEPKDACRIALRRKKVIEFDHKRCCEHEYD